jgi:small subunit ribosomal protein S8
MPVTDPIGDMLTIIRNASMVGKPQVNISASKFKKAIGDVLKKEGYIKDCKFVDTGKQGVLRIQLKYTPKKEPIITAIKRISKPSRRVYVGVKDIPLVLNGWGTAVLSTPKGVLTDRECRNLKVGGEVLFYIW